VGGHTTTGWPLGRPLFSDPTGTRWRRIMFVGTMLLLVLVGLLAWSAPAALAPVWSADRNTDAAFPYALVHGHDAVPAIGSEIFTRIARVERTGGVVQLADPFSDAVFRRATAREAEEIGNRDPGAHIGRTRSRGPHARRWR
jgi:hypothetical protein